MDSSIFRISLDIHRQTTQTHLAVRKGDTARKIVAALSDGGRPYRIREGCYAVFRGKKPDGNVLYNDCAIINNCIVYEFTEQTAASAGHMPCELQLYGPDGKLITSPKFSVIVSGLVYDDSEVESSSEFTALAQAMTDLAELRVNGLKGDAGDSAYEVAVGLGFEGSEAEWVESLRGPVGLEGPQGPKGDGNALRVIVSRDGEKYVADKTVLDILEAESLQQPVYLQMEPFVLPLVSVSQSSALFQMENRAEYMWVLVKVDGSVEVGGGNYAKKTDLKPPLYVTLTLEDGAKVGQTSHTHADILAAHNAERDVWCVVNDKIKVPLININASVAIFQGPTYDGPDCQVRFVSVWGNEAQVADVEYAKTEDLSAYALARNVTSESYFDITDDGVVSLKPEYRGVCRAGVPDTMASDNGVGVVGTRYSLLPEEIIIPETVNGIAVTALSSGMFFGNKRIKRLEIPAYIEQIPSHFCRDAWNLVQIKGTESVKTLGSYAFYATGLLEVSLPALEGWSTNGKLHFSRCANLVTVELGDSITTIPEGCFQACEKLAEVRGASNVTTIGPYSFYITQRLKTLPFLAQLTEIGDCGLLISRVHLTDEDGSDIIPAGCTLGKFATAKQFYGLDYWSACEPQVCNKPLRSTFNQDDPRWGNKTFGNFKRAWGKGCGTVCAAMIYSAFENKDLYSPEEFADVVYTKAPELMDVDPGTADDGLQRYLEAVGYKVTKYPEFNMESLQAMYDALADGALVIHRCLSGAAKDTEGHWIAGAHDVLIHGINADGEVLVADPAAQSKLIGKYDVNHCAMPIQNRSRAGEIQDTDGDGDIDEEDAKWWKDWFWVVRKT